MRWSPPEGWGKALPPTLTDRLSTAEEVQIALEEQLQVPCLSNSALQRFMKGWH